MALPVDPPIELILRVQLVYTKSGSMALPGRPSRPQLNVRYCKNGCHFVVLLKLMHMVVLMTVNLRRVCRKYTFLYLFGPNFDTKNAQSQHFQ